MKMRITHPPIKTRRNPKCSSKSASERLQRPIVGIQCDVRHGLSGMRQLKGCPLQQQPPSHGSRSLFDDRSEQPVELRAALVRLARQILRLRLTVKRPHYKCSEAVCRILTNHFLHASGSSR